jgi:hypothetical protein
MSSTSFEPEGSSSGRRLYIPVRHHLFTFNGTNSLQPTRLLIALHVNILNHTCSYNILPEDELSGSKDVEDILKIKVLV